jgi:CRP-like cAMP-binding protein
MKGGALPTLRCQREGEAGESFYIVAAVHAEVTRRGGQLLRGSYFGETELLRSDLPRTATVRAADDTILHVGVLARERFIAP